MPSVLLATCAELPDGDEDGAVLYQALADRGVSARWAAWTDRSIDWAAALVVLRSTWDYTADRAAFLAWVTALPRVANDAAVVRWNTDKIYLADLTTVGVPIVPTAFARPGERTEFPADVGEFVVKPSVGAGSRGAGRFSADDTAAAAAHTAHLHAAGRTVLVQPYVDAVDEAGETALIYIDGRFSHAVRKAAMLPAGVAHPVQGWELYIEEQIEPQLPDAAELAVGSAALEAVRDRFGGDPLYARVDLLPTPDGPVVIELELTEPSLFLQYATPGTDPAAAFAAAIAERL
jgi:glutathione synthase/RimK-type ligase-like ATP-grasp enzyme